MSQVPDHRIEEMMQNFRRMEQENMRLRGTVDALMAQRTQAPEPQEDSPFQPEVERALQARFDREMAKRFQPIEQQTKAAIGALADQNDQLRFSLMYGQDTLTKYQDKIERIREERSRAGQWISREDAYKHIFFEEKGKQPAATPQAAQAPAAPAIDPYTGMMREQAPVETQPPQAPQQAVPFQPAAPVAPQVPQVEQTSVPPLPPQTMSPVTPATQTQITNVPAKLELEMDSKQYDAWADKFANIPL